MGLSYLRKDIYERAEIISAKLLKAKRVKNFFKHTFVEKDNYDSLLANMILLDDTRKQNEKPDPEFQLLDSTKKVIKGVWGFSGAVADVMIKGTDLIEQKIKQAAKNYHLNRPTDNAVLYIGKHVLVERIDEKDN